jgi:hypothetical protein
LNQRCDADRRARVPKRGLLLVSVLFDPFVLLLALEKNMTEPNDSGRRRNGDVFARQLRHSDEKVSDFRKFYESLETDKRAEFRSWLEKVKALNEEGAQWSAQLRVRTEYDGCDENGETLRWADAEFSARTAIDAVKAWDAGENFSPDTVLP